MNIQRAILKVFTRKTKDKPDPCAQVKNEYLELEQDYLVLEKTERELIAEYHILKSKQEELEKNYRSLEKRIKDLERSEFLLKEAQKIAHLGHYIFFMRNSNWETSETLDEIFGIDSSYERNFDSWISLILPEERSRMSEFFLNQVLKVQEPFDMECHIVRFSDKQVRCIHCLGNMRNDDRGNPVEVFGVIQDITHRKQLEEKLQKSEQIKSLLYERLNEAQKIAKIGSWEWDIQSGCMWWSDELYRIFEVNPDEFVPRLESNEKYFHPEDVSAFNEAVDHCMKTGDPLDFEMRIITGSGTEKYCKTTGKVYFDNWGKPIRFNGTFMDMTAQKHYEDELKLAKDKAQENDRLKTVFLQNMSHEIRTPMNAIVGFSDLLADNFDKKEKLLSFTNIIKQRSADLLELINDILDLSKIETGQLPVHMEKFSLSELFKELKKFFMEHRQKIKKTHIDILVSNCYDQSIITDKVKLKQIFINLIHNALKFTNKGFVKFGCTYENEKFLFFVTDTGIGIPAEKHGVVFERFVQLDTGNKNASRGTGLGLSIVKGLVELLGGEISLKSEVGAGSTFTFTIPFESAGHQITKHRKETEIKSVDWHAYTVLIVEDDTANLEFLNELLKGTGITMLNAFSAQEAIDYVKSSQPINIILMDIQLPDLNGYEATRIIKEVKPEIKVIAQTAYASEEDRRKSIESGCNDYISKPIYKDVLFSKVGHILEKESV